MSLVESISLSGEIWADAYDPDTGAVRSRERWRNKLIFGSVSRYLRILSGEVLPIHPVTHIAWGAGATPTDPAAHPLAAWGGPLEDERLRKEIASSQMIGPGRVQFAFELRTTEANNFAPSEWGLLCVHGGGTELLARVVRPALPKTARIAYRGGWILNFQANV